MRSAPASASASGSAIDPEKTYMSQDLKYTAPLVSCLFDPSGKYAFAGAQDRKVVRWDLQNEKTAVLDAHESWVRALGTSRDGEYLLTGGYDGRLIWWPLHDANPRPVRDVTAHEGWLRALAVSPDGTRVATCGNDHHVKIWSMADGGLMNVWTGHKKPVYSMVFHPNGYHLVSADLEGVVTVWEVPTGKNLRTLDAKTLYSYNGGQQVDYGGVRDLCFSKDKTQVICGGLIEGSNPLGAVNTPALVTLDYTTGKQVFLQRPKEDYKGVVWGVRAHRNGFTIGAIGGNNGGALMFWKPGEANPFAVTKFPSPGRGMDIHPDGIRVAVAQFDGHLRIYSMTTQPPKPPTPPNKPKT